MSFKYLVYFSFSCFDLKMRERVVDICPWDKSWVVNIKLFEKCPKSSFIKYFCNFHCCSDEFRV